MLDLPPHAVKNPRAESDDRCGNGVDLRIHGNDGYLRCRQDPR